MAWYEMLSKQYRHMKGVLPLSLSLMFLSFGWALVLPIFSIRINDITGNTFLTGIIFSIWGFVCLALDIPVGILSDRFNKKRMLQLSLIGYVFVTFLYTVVNNFITLALLRILHSLIGCVFWITSWAIIRQSTIKKYSEEDLGAYTSIKGLSEVLGPIIGAIVIVYLGWAMPFYMLSFLSFVTFVSVSLLKIKSYEDKEDGLIKEEITNFLSRGRRIWGLLFGIVVIFSVSAGFGSFLPIFMEDIGFNYEEIGIVLAIAMTLPWVILPVPIGIYADRHGRLKTAVWGFLITALGFAVFNLSFEFVSILVSSFIISTGLTFCGLTFNTMVGDITVKKEYGGFTGITEAPKDLANIIGPLLVGFYLPIIGMGSTALISAALSLISLPVFYVLMK